MGLVMLVNDIVILPLARTRLPPRKQGNWIELSAFKELPYFLFTIGIYLVLWAVYMPYNYVSFPQSLRYQLMCPYR